MNQLASIRAFVKVADNRSFAKAAKQLGVSASVITRSIALLENHLGARLVDRTTRRASLTSTGELYRQHCEELIRLLESMDACVATAAGMPAATLKIAASASFAATGLPGLLAAHRAFEPRTTFELTVFDNIADIAATDFDVCFGTEQRLRDSTRVCRPLGPMVDAIVASPDYLARRGTPRTPQELASHDALPSTDAPRCNWEFDADGATYRTELRPVLNPQPPLAVKRAALAGLGVARLPRALVDAELDSGALRALLPDVALRDAERTVWALYAKQPSHTSAVRNFVDFAVAHCRGHASAYAPAGRHGATDRHERQPRRAHAERLAAECA
ncbi:LysR family transcriptional regulator [Burkholderia dolosa]|jgi:DNA-binding transcriptional LysR family regulator|uniref:LysR family transcriptional regulator n=1 Tax=Burkholderia dolosa TaxID=152500 RepID=A0A892I2A0_9BURK|nr:MULTISPECIES: LysR family transcriptional regulator [Burkholderia]AJY13224.1 bacterial regulatory helix-turn-helix, lysR family protein [Burkholderia dolosa AU0158]ETP65497.1 LysR family transcriptional regulator [Burkholderia dolosa PC543]MBR8421073.1 LysR family transcriptional regulator [Burkholderia dolosa]MBY4659637.1 LysR family transcriptional regulator [Burkholderia dolosa]MBY4690837.1 LysR family transcriptional regulator [Burkholderia dolosa]